MNVDVRFSPTFSGAPRRAHGEISHTPMLRRLGNSFPPPPKTKGVGSGFHKYDVA